MQIKKLSVHEKSHLKKKTEAILIPMPPFPSPPQIRNQRKSHQKIGYASQKSKVVKLWNTLSNMGWQKVWGSGSICPSYGVDTPSNVNNKTFQKQNKNSLFCKKDRQVISFVKSLLKGDILR